MQQSIKIISLVVLSIILLIIIFIAFHLIFLQLLVDFWWYSSLDYTGYFWLRTLYQYLIPGAVTLCFLFIFYSNFWIASRFLGIKKEIVKQSETEQQTTNDMLKKFRHGAAEVYLPLSLLLSVLVALPFHFHWEKALLFFFSQNSGIKDPIFDFDISFYLFSFPIYQLIHKQLLGITVIVFFAVAFLYWLEHRVFIKQINHYPKGVRIHLSIIAFLIVLYGLAWFIIEQFNLLYTNDHEPIFYGPGYVEMRYKLPLIRISMVLFCLWTINLAWVYFSHGRKGKKPALILSVVFALVLLLKDTDLIPALINKVIVQPNPVVSEQSYMYHNTKATLDAYALDKVHTFEFKPTLNPLNDLLSWEGRQHLDNVPLWDRQLLKDVYYQLQGLRPYYSFPAVNEDRYTINNRLKQVNISARELNPALLPEPAKNWENLHLRYTHGYGAVMTPAAQNGGQIQRWFLRGLNLDSSVGIKLKQPEIFYGLEDYRYAIVPNDLKIAGISGIDQTLQDNRMESGGGIAIKSILRKLLLAIYFQDKNIFFSVNITERSRLMMARNIIQRIEKLTPYLTLDSDPYPVISQENLYWIQDAYTLSNWYPYSKRNNANFTKQGQNVNQSFNYFRNAVKIVVDAFNGKTWFYIADEQDPVIKTYQTAYPGVFKPLAEMPNHLQKHLRYPRDMFNEQMEVYKYYHQIDPVLFYQQSETWDFPKLGSKKLPPYYLTTELPDCENKPRFVQIALMTPVNRDNLSAFATADILDAVRCDDSYKPEITVYTIARDIQVNGPVQISALIDQDPAISKQMTLWDQHGSRVVRGRMILMPVGNTVLYIQPLYLISTKTKIPELARVIVAAGNQASMATSAAEAFKQLEIKLGADPSLFE